MSGNGSNITYYTPDETTLHRPPVTDARFTFGGMVVCSLPGHSARFSFGGLCSGVWRVICVVVPYSKPLLEWRGSSLHHGRDVGISTVLPRC
jgi:hypothetical protein